MTEKRSEEEQQIWEWRHMDIEELKRELNVEKTRRLNSTDKDYHTKRINILIDIIEEKKQE